MKRISHIDCAKGVAIFSVVWGHGIQDVNANIMNSTQFFTHILYYTSFLPLFFIISGALSYSSINKLSIFDILKKYFITLIMPFFVINILFFFINIIITLYTNKIPHIPTPQNMITSLITLNIDENLPLGILWFLFSLFLCTIIASLIAKYISINLLIIILIGSILNILSIYLYNINYFSLYKTFFYFIYFGVGLCLSNQILTPVKNIKLSVFLFILFFILYSLHKILKYPFLHTAASIIGPLLLIETLKYLCTKKVFCILRILGNYSLQIYIFHKPFQLYSQYFNFFYDEIINIYSFTAWIFMVIALSIGTGLLIGMSHTLHKSIFFRLPQNLLPNSSKL